jgi:membrane protein implicated in regulation of membrane protease activity
MFAWIFKILAILTSMVTTALLVAESLRRGLLIASTIFGIVKVVVIFLFFAILAVILYLLLKDAFRNRSTEEPL